MVNASLSLITNASNWAFLSWNKKKRIFCTLEQKKSTPKNREKRKKDNKNTCTHALILLVFVEGVPHGADLFYIFGIPYTGVHPYNKQDIEASSLMMTMWSNYVKTGSVVPVRQNRISSDCTSTQDQ